MLEHSGCYFDRQEVRAHDERERSLFHALPGLIRHAIDNAPFFTQSLKGVDPDDITSREQLAALPILRKDELMQSQGGDLPFGSLAATAPARLAHVFCSPGPIYDPEGARPDYWRFARALYAAGIRQGDLVHNSFSYHMTPAGLMIDGAARALGCPVFPAGTGQTDRQIEIIRDLKPKAYVGTPSFLLILLTRAKELGLTLDSLENAMVSGEAFPAETRDRLKLEHGVDAYQSYGTADVGLIAYESEGREGMIADESLILEIVRPGTGIPVGPGAVGEIVVTMFNPDYPLIRFATGDLTRKLVGQSPCGRTNVRIAGWMGRADQRTKVRGMFIVPKQVQQLIEPHKSVRLARLMVTHHDGQDELLLRCETDPAGDAALQTNLAKGARSVFGLRCEIELLQAGTLPNDGKIIDDTRPVS